MACCSTWEDTRRIFKGLRITEAVKIMKSKAKRQVCILLPNKQHLDCTVEFRAKGQDVLDIALEQLEISRLQVLGLAVLRDNEYLFIDLEQKIVKYFGKSWRRASGKMDTSILFLRIQYYVDSGRLIPSSLELQLCYAELRQKVLRSQSRHQEALFFQLASHALQAQVGDLEIQDRKHKHYFLPEDYFPSWLIKQRGRDYLLQHCPVLHEELRGVSHREAVLGFVRLANTVEDVPVTMYRMRQEKKDMKKSILFGVAPNGVSIYQDVEGKRCLLHEFSWTDMEHVTFQGCRFEIHAVGSLCLPKLVFYSQSAPHSRLVLKHLRDSHRFTITVRDALSHVRQMEEIQASQLCREAYICDTTLLRQRLRRLTSSMTDCTTELETSISWWNDEEEEQDHDEDEEDQSLQESEEVFIDSPAEVSWLAELLYGVSVDGPLVLPPSHWTAVTMEMKQVLRSRADSGFSVD